MPITQTWVCERVTKVVRCRPVIGTAVCAADRWAIQMFLFMRHGASEFAKWWVAVVSQGLLCHSSAANWCMIRCYCYYYITAGRVPEHPILWVVVL